MNEFIYLNKIDCPEDLKKLEVSELPRLCDEIRSFLVDSISKSGGHLSSNIGVVELSVGVHYVFNSPKDHIMFDVGHQSYVHKIITGRKDRFDSLRKQNGLSGFLKPDESVHDCFATGHSSNSISAMLGMARADKINGIDAFSVALIGDGALTGGMAYEALNDAGCSDLPLIIILNDNDMSISKSVGGLADWLSNIRLSPKYFSFKEGTVNFLKKFGRVGNKLVSLLSSIKRKVRKNVLPENMFSVLGFKYLGPADGNDIESVINILNEAKKLNKPVVVHFKTVKGKGYSYSEDAPDEYHSVSAFNADLGHSNAGSDTFSSVFGKSLVSLASSDYKICAVTAAMDMGTGLTVFKESYPDRFFDVGIAEQHAVTMSAGMAKQGLIPVCAIYSTFLQRAYDQLLEDIALNNVHVVFGVDRSGSVGSDGPTHHGLFDTSYLRSIPGMAIYAPSSFSELESFVRKAVYENNGPVAIKYPRGREGDYIDNSSDYDSVLLREGADATIISYGILINEALKAANILAENNISVDIIKINRLDRFDKDMIIKSCLKTERVFICEESVQAGGIGEAISSLLSEVNCLANTKLINFGETFGEIGTVYETYINHGLDSKNLASCVIDTINAESRSNNE